MVTRRLPRVGWTFSVQAASGSRGSAGCRHSRIRYSKPGSSTIGIGSGDAGATAPTTIFASSGDERGLGGDRRGDDLDRVSIGACHGTRVY